MTVESFPLERTLLAQDWMRRRRFQFTSRLPLLGAPACRSMEDRNKVYKELGGYLCSCFLASYCGGAKSVLGDTLVVVFGHMRIASEDILLLALPAFVTYRNQACAGVVRDCWISSQELTGGMLSKLCFQNLNLWRSVAREIIYVVLRSSSWTPMLTDVCFAMIGRE